MSQLVTGSFDSAIGVPVFTEKKFGSHCNDKACPPFSSGFPVRCHTSGKRLARRPIWPAPSTERRCRRLRKGEWIQIGLCLFGSFYPVCRQPSIRVAVRIQRCRCNPNCQRTCRSPACFDMKVVRAHREVKRIMMNLSTFFQQIRSI